MQIDSNDAKIGLILTGGGARAAYQVGVLQVIAELLREHGRCGASPFKVVCGTSAGAINATALASRSDNFDESVFRIVDVWKNFSAEQVYRADSLGVLRTGARWLTALSFGWMLRKRPKSLLDNSPLADLLHKMIDLARLDQCLEYGHLRALAVTASSYSSGYHVTFYQTLAEIQPWIRTQRIAQPDQITIQHLLASAAIPFVFPSIPLIFNQHREFFGDGSMRQLAPISPAIHLGADRVLIIGAGQMRDSSTLAGETSLPHASYPSLAQIAGHALSSIFLDSLAMDIERLSRVNHTIRLLPPEVQQRSALRAVDVLVIAPSQRLDYIAARHVAALPAPIRILLGGIGATEQRGSALASYLLFESAYTQELIELGRHDTLNRKAEVLDFFGVQPAQ